MRPRYGRLYASAVLNALAEQALDALDVAADDTACDLMCDGGVMTRLLGARAARVIALDSDAELSEAAASGAAEVDAGVMDGRCVHLAPASCEGVASLLTLGFAEVSALLGEAERLLRVGGRMAVVLWDREHPPPHEQALREALAGVGHESAFLSRVMPAVDIPASRRVSRLRDVARFDGASHAWSALVDDRPLAEEISGLDRSAVDEVRASVSTALERYAGADGTLRIPVEAMLLG